MLLAEGQHGCRHVGAKIVANQDFDVVFRQVFVNVRQEHLKKIEEPLKSVDDIIHPLFNSNLYHVTTLQYLQKVSLYYRNNLNDDIIHPLYSTVTFYVFYTM